MNEDYEAGDYQPYAIEWGGYNNVFWTGKDGKVYWNRYDGETEWTGAKDCRTPPMSTSTRTPRTRSATRTTTPSTPTPSARTAPRTGTPSTARAGAGGRRYESGGRGQGYQPYAYEYDGVQHDRLHRRGRPRLLHHLRRLLTWSDWHDLGDNYAYDAYSYEYDDAYYLTYTGENGYLYYKEYKAGEGGRLLSLHEYSPAVLALDQSPTSARFQPPPFPARWHSILPYRLARSLPSNLLVRAGHLLPSPPSKTAGRAPETAPAPRSFRQPEPPIGCRYRQQVLHSSN